MSTIHGGEERALRLESAEKLNIKYQLGFEQQLEVVASTRLNKTIEYGEKIFEELDDFPYIISQIYSDLLRKFLRLKQLKKDLSEEYFKMKFSLKENMTPEEEAIFADKFKLMKKRFYSMKDDIKDISVYGVIGMQLMEELENKLDKVYMDYGENENGL